MFEPEIREFFERAEDEGLPLATELLRLDGLVDRYGYEFMVMGVIEAANHPLLFAMLYYTEWCGEESVCQDLLDERSALRTRGYPEAEYTVWTAKARSFLLHRAALLN
jgi:hypothetical protein